MASGRVDRELVAGLLVVAAVALARALALAVRAMYPGGPAAPKQLPPAIDVGSTVTREEIEGAERGF